jgi:hypothetical protein
MRDSKMDISKICLVIQDILAKRMINSNELRQKRNSATRIDLALDAPGQLPDPSPKSQTHHKISCDSGEKLPEPKQNSASKETGAITHNQSDIWQEEDHLIQTLYEFMLGISPQFDTKINTFSDKNKITQPEVLNI